jgi:hypothetical protein
MLSRFLRLVAGSVLLAFAWGSNAVERFEGTFLSTTQYGASPKESRWRMAIEIEDFSASKLEGKIFSPDSKRCPAEAVAVGTMKDDQIVFRARDLAELKGCGRLNFRGRREGDSLIGTTFFEGGEREILLKRK